jgi:hypothetical protein
MKEHSTPVKRTVNILINKLMLHQLVSPYDVCVCVWTIRWMKTKWHRVSNFPHQRLHTHTHWCTSVLASLSSCIQKSCNCWKWAANHSELWFILYLIYSLFGNAVSISGYTVLNGRMTKLVRNCKRCGRSQPEYNFWYCPSICLKELNKTTQNLTQASWSESWDWDLMHEKQ